jgi:hypothetical protein
MIPISQAGISLRDLIAYFGHDLLTREKALCAMAMSIQLRTRINDNNRLITPGNPRFESLLPEVYFQHQSAFHFITLLQSQLCLKCHSFLTNKPSQSCNGSTTENKWRHLQGRQPPWLVIHTLDVIPIEVKHKCCIISLHILWSLSGFTVVFRSCFPTKQHSNQHLSPA